MPLKIPFFRLGKWKHPAYGDLNITQDTFNQLLANFKENVLGRPPFIRIGHDKGNNNTFGSAPAEGWVKDLKQEGNVLYAEVDPTNEQVATDIKSKRYRFSSAEYNPNGVSKETGQNVGALLSAIALTNEPFLTKLPESTLLADTPDTFYMDFSDIKGDDNMPDPEVKTLIQKLSDTMNNFMSNFKLSAPAPAPTAAPPKESNEMAQALAEMQEQIKNFSTLQTQVQQLTEENKQLSEQVGTEAGKRQLAETDRLAAEMVSQGIPPIMVEQWKALALSEPGQINIKLADKEGKETQMTQAEAMRNMLLALPEEHRIKMGQRGTQSTPKPQEEIKLACDEDVMAAGGKVDKETGKYII